MTVTVGVRELRENLKLYLDRVREGEEVVVTDRGDFVARIVPHRTNRERMIAEGRIRPALEPWRPIDRTGQLVPKGWSLSELVFEQHGHD